MNKIEKAYKNLSEIDNSNVEGQRKSDEILSSLDQDEQKWAIDCLADEAEEINDVIDYEKFINGMCELNEYPELNIAIVKAEWPVYEIRAPHDLEGYGASIYILSLENKELLEGVRGLIGKNPKDLENILKEIKGLLCVHCSSNGYGQY